MKSLTKTRRLSSNGTPLEENLKKSKKKNEYKEKVIVNREMS
jgi:hypothetical protein